MALSLNSKRRFSIKELSTLFAFLERSFRLTQRVVSLILALSIVAVVGSISVFWGEKLSINGGFGWDGLIYGSVAQNLNFRSLTDFYFLRTLPSVLVHAALAALRQPYDNQHIVLGFGLLNLGMMIALCILLRQIADELGLSERAFWFVFAAIFVNVANFKLIWYFSLGTDPTAEALALAMLLFYLRRQEFRLFLVSLLGAFTWPTLIFAGTFLLLFRRDPVRGKEAHSPKWVSVALAAFVSAGAVLHYYVHHEGLGAGLAQPIRWALPISIFCAGLYFYLGSEILLSGMSLKVVLKQIVSWRIAFVLLLWAATWVPTDLWANHSADSVTAASTIRDIIERSTARPAVFLVSHPVCLGPAFLMFFFCWRNYSSIIRRYGAGLVAVILMGIFVSLTPESHQNIPIYVLAAPFLGILVDELNLPSRFYWLFGALALFSTKVWMPMHLPAYDDGQFLRFPMQRLFMNTGVWMNNLMWLIQGVIVLAAATLLYPHVRRALKETRAEPLPQPE
jgi:hypothetical protein